MNQAQILDYAQTCLILVLKLSLIPILVATVIGVIVSLLQALTQIQEQTLGFAVKLIAISITLLACASWMGSTLLLYTQDIFVHFALLGK
ncbi:MAG: type III secretion system export apparatus subunit SctS [Kiritimatiellae bacterium]|nr:type III secretion system export apparatus subunit SctS [Kiritimatiellia bacterium]